MDEIVMRAKIILSNIFDIELKHFENHSTRIKDVMEARKYLMYFLRSEICMTYHQIVKYIPAITNHATVIHHCKRMEELLDVERPLIRRYNIFVDKVLNDEKYFIETEIARKINDRKKINNELYKLKKML